MPTLDRLLEILLHEGLIFDRCLLDNAGVEVDNLIAQRYREKV